MKKIDQVGKIYLLLAGSCDGVSGVLLVAAPLMALRLMGVTTMPLEPVYMQWIGAFVFAVGFSHFIPFLSRDPATFSRRAISILEITAFMRLVIGTFAGISILRGALGAEWISVPLTDLSLAAAQIILLARGVFSPASR